MLFQVFQKEILEFFQKLNLLESHNTKFKLLINSFLIINKLNRFMKKYQTNSTIFKIRNSIYILCSK